MKKIEIKLIPKVFVNEEKGAVVVVLEGGELNPYALMEEWGNCEEILKEEEEKGYPSYRIRNRYVGKAYCMKEDDFDAWTGYELAVNRAYAKYYEDFSKALYKLRGDLLESIDELIDFPNSQFKSAAYRLAFWEAKTGTIPMTYNEEDIVNASR